MIWHKLTEKHRPIVLSIGLQQLKQDMRYRVKVVNLSEHHHPISKRTININSTLLHNDHEYLTQLSNKSNGTDTPENQDVKLEELKIKYSIQNWQFEIRKLSYDDAGTYSCLLPLVKPINKNITLQVIRKIY